MGSLNCFCSLTDEEVRDSFPRRGYRRNSPLLHNSALTALSFYQSVQRICLWGRKKLPINRSNGPSTSTFVFARVSVPLHWSMNPVKRRSSALLPGVDITEMFSLHLVADLHIGPWCFCSYVSSRTGSLFFTFTHFLFPHHSAACFPLSR